MDTIRKLQSRLSKRGAEIAKLELLTRWTKENLKSARRALRGAVAEYYVRALELRIYEMMATFQEENTRRRALANEQKLDRQILKQLRIGKAK